MPLTPSDDELLAAAATAYATARGSDTERLDAARLGVVTAAWVTATGDPIPAELLVDLPQPTAAPALGLRPEQCGTVIPRLAALTIESDRLSFTRARRRRRGAYTTPPWLVDWTLDRVGAAAAATMLDPACGAGAFLTGGLRAGLTPSGIRGCDADPAAVLAARIVLTLAGLDPATAAAHVVLRDALLDPPSELVDIVVGNPPWGLGYSPAQRRELAALGHAVDPGELCSAALFLRAAARLVKPGGRVALVLPESWLSTRRAEPLRRWLLDEVDLYEIDVLRKRVFLDAPDMVPTVVAFRRAAASGRAVAVHRYGLHRELPVDEELDWLEAARVEPHLWRAEPLGVFAVGSGPDLQQLWARLRETCHPLGAWVTAHDGVYKTHLLPQLGETGRLVLTQAAEVRALQFLHRGARIPESALDQLPEMERQRQTSPKILLHAMRKPALTDRLVAALDRDGRYLASNNFLLLVRREACPVELAALAVLLNTRLVNRWYADRFFQVNIEGFALSAIPVPPVTTANETHWHDLAALADRATEYASWRDAAEGLAAKLYGVSPAEQRLVETRWAGDL